MRRRERASDATVFARANTIRDEIRIASHRVRRVRAAPWTFTVI
jgi:hypothetical protein